MNEQVDITRTTVISLRMPLVSDRLVFLSVIKKSMLYDFQRKRYCFGVLSTDQHRGKTGVLQDLGI